jgi:hypothetical protein
MKMEETKEAAVSTHRSGGAHNSPQHWFGQTPFGKFRLHKETDELTVGRKGGHARLGKTEGGREGVKECE